MLRLFGVRLLWSGRAEYEAQSIIPEKVNPEKIKRKERIRKNLVNSRKTFQLPDTSLSSQQKPPTSPLCLTQTFSNISKSSQTIFYLILRSSISIVFFFNCSYIFSEFEIVSLRYFLKILHIWFCHFNCSQLCSSCLFI